MVKREIHVVHLKLGQNGDLSKKHPVDNEDNKFRQCDFHVIENTWEPVAPKENETIEESEKTFSKSVEKHQGTILFLSDDLAIHPEDDIKTAEIEPEQKVASGDDCFSQTGKKGAKYRTTCQVNEEEREVFIPLEHSFSQLLTFKFCTALTTLYNHGNAFVKDQITSYWTWLIKLLRKWWKPSKRYEIETEVTSPRSLITSSQHGKLLILMLLAVCIGGISCQDMSSGEKIDRVQHCPRNEKEWRTAEERKNCSDNLKYHCVVNQHLNMTLEVCAPVTVINGGLCAEYNMVGNTLQGNKEADCSHFAVPCPYHYKSTDAYKYQACYSLVKNEEPETTNSYPVSSDQINRINTAGKHNGTSDDRDIGKGYDIKPIVVIVILGVIAVCIGFVILCYRYRKCKDKRPKKETVENDAASLEQPMMEV